MRAACTTRLLAAIAAIAAIVAIAIASRRTLVEAWTAAPGSVRRKNLIVVADCEDAPGLRKIQAMAQGHGFGVLVYDKCGACTSAPEGAACATLPNVGREGHTFLHYVVANYDRLPAEIILTPSALHKHGREARLAQLLATAPEETGCGAPVRGMGDFTLDTYEGRAVAPADVRPFRAWYETYVGAWTDTPTACWNGLMRTSRDRILRHPKRFYTTLLGSFDGADTSEVGHFIERCMGDIF